MHPFVVEGPSGIVGYALIKSDEDGRGWLTAGLTEGMRGKGIGTRVFEFLASTATFMGLVPSLEVFEFNAPGRAVYEKLGFTEIGRYGSVIQMEKR
jgi:predicted GNAT family acetyltransferase